MSESNRGVVCSRQLHLDDHPANDAPEFRLVQPLSLVHHRDALHLLARCPGSPDGRLELRVPVASLTEVLAPPRPFVTPTPSSPPSSQGPRDRLRASAQWGGSGAPRKTRNPVSCQRDPR